MKKINELDASMPRQRLYEIDFYYYIKRLLLNYQYSVIIFDLADAFAQFGEVDSTIIKKLIQEILTDTATWAPSKEESFMVYKRLGYSMRKMKDVIGLAPNTQYRIQASILEDKRLVPACVPRLDDHTFQSIRSFMDQITRFKGV